MLLASNSQAAFHVQKQRFPMWIKFFHLQRSVQYTLVPIYSSWGAAMTVIPLFFPTLFDLLMNISRTCPLYRPLQWLHVEDI